MLENRPIDTQTGMSETENVRKTPSRFIKPFVPNFARQRWGTHIEKAEDAIDAIWHGDDHRSGSLRTAFIAFVIRVFSAVIAYASQIIIARLIGTHEYGIFVWVWLVVIMLSGLTSLGFSSSVTRFIPQYQVSGDEAALRGVSFGSRLYAFLVSTAVSVVGVVLLLLFQDAAENIYLLPLLLAATCLPVLAVSEISDGIARTYNWAHLSMLPTFIIRPLGILVVMVTALTLGFEANAVTAMGAAIVATWATTVWQLVRLSRLMRKEVPAGPRTMKPKLWIAVSVPILLVDGFFNLLTNVDIMIVGIYLPPSDVAIYFAAVKTLALVHFAQFAIKAAAAHRYALLHELGDKQAFEEYVLTTAKWTFLPSIAVALLLLISGQFLLSLFGPDFTSAYSLLFVLVIGIVARSCVGPAESVLNMTGEQTTCAAVYGFVLLINVVLNLILIPQFGLMGAAIATSTALVAEAVILYFVIRMRLGINMSVFSSLTHRNETS